MNQLTEALNIVTTEHRHEFLCSITAQFVTSLEHQGFTFEELLDGLANYAYFNAYPVDTVFGLVKATLAATKAKKLLEVRDDVTP